ncbi:MAG TPA: tRNA (guanine(10)-N(2))-dimethyltransferase [Methanothrix sp.]|nr:tRNA (guanine(10)-N(2))-dimethyltransferase [Methanothrix sp.]HPJ84619.1 tRNA (guanine(10)-N(2))-dimethyltransferase [Methanothrix sp.]
MVQMVEEGAVVLNVEGAFYNPKMKMNRDIGVAVAKALGITDYLDALAASGARGLRVAKEAKVEEVALNDVSPKAVALLEENAKRNGLGACEILSTNANVLMHQRHFEAVDLDPFGSPSPFLAAASRSALEYLFITATDTAPLCGAHLKSGIRKYMAVPVKADHHREMGVRILLGAVARELARVDKGMHPLLTHVSDHYARVYLRVAKGAKMADKTLEGMGHLEQCRSCGRWRIVSGMACRSSGICSFCGGRAEVAGPLWLGPVQDRDLINRALGGLEGSKAWSERAVRLLQFCRDEIDEPMYYDHHKLCRKFKVTPGAADDVVEKLKSVGWKASRTHFSGVGIKTDAPFGVLKEVLCSI